MLIWLKDYQQRYQVIRPARKNGEHAGLFTGQSFLNHAGINRRTNDVLVKAALYSHRRRLSE